MSVPAIPTLPIDVPLSLPATGSWPPAVHIFDEQTVWALRAALAAQRPLLVRGEPGVGKSQLARAAAQAWGRLFVSTVVHARSESQDLQWQYDAIGRLGDAQALGAVQTSVTEVREQLAHRRYVSPGPLWWVFNWQSALDQYADSGNLTTPPVAPPDWQPQHGAVLLIDEIDKAEADLPNGLLETLGNGAFSVPWLNKSVGAQAGTPTPLVVITTNEERELPAAFVRRCLVLNLGLPENDVELFDLLLARGRSHFGADCHAEVYREAAQQLLADRRAARDAGIAPPGQAEYIDLLRVVKTLEPDVDQQLALLAKVRDFALKKHPQPLA